MLVVSVAALMPPSIVAGRAAPVRKVAKARLKPSPALEKCDPGKFRIILDVGHTPEAYGATSARNDTEFGFNLRLAKLIGERLKSAGFAATRVLVTDGKARPSLFKRAAAANAAHADFVLSIHHDSVPDKFLQKWTYEDEEHSYSDRFKGHSIFISKSNGNPAASLVFGRLLGQQLKAREMKYTPHYTEKFMGSRQRILVDKEAGVYRYDQLIVLKDTHMPAVLLEAGSIINRDEEVALATSDRHERIAAAAVDAVDAFCAIRQSPKPALVAHQPAARSGAKPGMQPASASAAPFSFLSPKKH
jgi:N-acetylmuramoyl-L-alanine amidase